MAARAWSRSELQDLVRGRTVAMYDATTEPIPIPEWLVSVAASVSVLPGGQRLAAVHQDDRDLVATGFLNALAAPGEMVEDTFRSRLDGVWYAERTRKVYLEGQHQIAGVVVAIERAEMDTDPDESTDASEDRSGEHDSVAWVLATLDTLGTVQQVEGRILDIFGCSPEDIVGRSVLDFLHRDAFADSLPMWLELLGHPGQTRTTRRCYHHPDGTELWVEATYLNRMTSHNDVLALIYDITDRRAQEQALRETHDEINHLAEELRLLAEKVPTAVFRAEADGRITFHNRRWLDLLGTAGPVKHLSDAVHPDDRAQLDAAVAELGTEDRTIRVKSIDGERGLAVTMCRVHDEGSELLTFVGSVEDITDELLLRELAERDRLTGLLNRRAMDDVVGDALGGRRECLVAFMDLNGFKLVNDTYGHEVGDEVLRAVGDRLRGVLRADDVAARYGGDEFVLLCFTDDADAEASISERLAAAFADPIEWDGGSWHPSGSVGIARPREGDDVGAVVRRADLAMFAVKTAAAPGIGAGR
jgi:diguanylate cyclase (GGDEF)-like protein/PAS domain S-box-containing protein